MVGQTRRSNPFRLAGAGKALLSRPRIPLPYQTKEDDRKTATPGNENMGKPSSIGDMLRGGWRRRPEWVMVRSWSRKRNWPG